jgi:serine phosphatase RsbU (regulator of sigma subunit)
MAALDREHQRVRHSLSLAMEVQQNLLPKTNPQIDGLDIAGNSIYCDETGGDYYDFLEVGTPGEGKIGVVVGDVSDHGIPSALLMATARALIRQRRSAFGRIDRVVSDVNRQLAQDVKDSGRFMTLFYAEIERPHKTIRWVNAGHEPAMIFDPVTDTFRDLNGGNNRYGFQRSATRNSTGTNHPYCHRRHMGSTQSNRRDVQQGSNSQYHPPQCGNDRKRYPKCNPGFTQAFSKRR